MFSTDSSPITVYNIRNELESDLRSLSAASLLAKIDLAEHGDTRELFAIYRDLIAADNQVQMEFENRKRAVLGDTATIIPVDKTVPADIEAKERCLALLNSAPWTRATSWLLNVALYPVAVAEKVYEPSETGYQLKDVIPVPYQLLDYSSGSLRIFDTDENGTPLQSSHEPDSDRYIVHRVNNLPIPDQWGGPMRSILFWILLRTMSRQWWADLLERYGNPFLKGKYSDEKGKNVLERAFRLAQKLGGIVIHKNTEVEICQAAAADSSGSHAQFIDLCSKEISKLIAGQTLSSNAEPTGIGAGATPLQGEVRDDIRKADCKALATTLRDQLLKQFCRINGLSGRPPIICFGSDSSAEVRSVIQTVQALGAAGFEPDDDAVASISERIGYGIRRKTVSQDSPFPLSVRPLSADSIPPSPASASGRLSAAFADVNAAIEEIIKSSISREDCLSKLQEFLSARNLDDEALILSEAMDSYAERALLGKIQ